MHESQKVKILRDKRRGQNYQTLFEAAGGLGQIGKWAKQVDPIISTNHISSVLILVFSEEFQCLYFHIFTWPPNNPFLDLSKVDKPFIVWTPKLKAVV